MFKMPESTSTIKMPPAIKNKSLKNNPEKPRFQHCKIFKIKKSNDDFLNITQRKS